MNSIQRHAQIAGSLFLLAMTASLVGGGLLEPILSVPDFLATSISQEYLLKTGVLLELINAISVIGIAVILYPILKQFNERIALGYFAFRLIESIVCIHAAFIPLLIMTLVHSHAEGGTPTGSNLQNLGVSLLAIRNLTTTLLIPIFFSFGAILFYFLLYKTRLIPRFISIWGFIGVLGILILALTEISGLLVMTFVLPVILNEIFLGVWLITKGFNPARI
ncbi:MAG TPA: DUF4386 domain-containing protein [Sunxiuqinia sp.]|nr:DUF4386 domain-containing protein [Sunxiuqinia sp.]